MLAFSLWSIGFVLNGKGWCEVELEQGDVEKNIDHLPPNIYKVFNPVNHGEKDLKEVLLRPNIPVNVTEASDIIKCLVDLVNPEGEITMATNCSLYGRRINRNEFGIIQHISTGKLEIIPSGRWIVFSPYVKWRGIFNLDKNLVRVDYLTILNIPVGYYGRVFENNYPLLLSHGRHVRLSGGVFSYRGNVRQNLKYFRHGIVHVLQIPPGEWARVEESLTSKLIPSGRHVFVSSRFRFFGMGGGKIIKNGTITRFRVDKGEMALAFKDQKPIVFTEAKFYKIDNPNFRFVKFVKANQKIIRLGSSKIVTVNTGEVGVSYREGELVILDHGTHFLDHENHSFDSFMSIQQRTLDLSARADEIENDESNDRYFECETKDLVKVGLRAILLVKVVDPRLTLLEIGDQEKIDKLLVDTALACLNGIIRSTQLTDVSVESNEGPKRKLKDLIRMHDKKKDDEEEEEETEGEDKKKDNKCVAQHEQQQQRDDNVTLFFKRAHDEFLLKLRDRFLRDYGIDIVDLRIENLKIMDEISKQAIVSATVQTQLANLKGQNKVMLSEYNREARTQNIQNIMESEKLSIVTVAENEALVLSAKAQASQERIVAEGRAEVIRIESTARAEAKKVQSEADKKYVELMGSSELGKQMALLKMKTQMVQKALEGVDKVVYMDSNRPLSFFENSTNQIENLGSHETTSSTIKNEK